jgi:hypothetical protein
MFDPSAWRAGVLHEDPFRRNLVVVIGAVSDGSTPPGTFTAITEIGKDSVALTRVEENAEAPTLRIPTDAARALYDALAQHFGGTSNSKQLRADYDAERGRVDKLIGTLTTLVTKESP